jgi:hypothetical protein
MQVICPTCQSWRGTGCPPRSRREVGHYFAFMSQRQHGIRNLPARKPFLSYFRFGVCCRIPQCQNATQRNSCLRAKPRSVIHIGRSFLVVACFESACGQFRPAPSFWVLAEIGHSPFQNRPMINNGSGTERYRFAAFRPYLKRDKPNGARL